MSAVLSAQEGYLKFRGKCRELSEKACSEDSSLKLIRGYYYCPIWNVEEQHWWAIKPDGKIVDPSCEQYPSKGLGRYTEFNGIVNCEECHKELREDEVKNFQSRYAFCSGKCFSRFVGLTN